MAFRKFQPDTPEYEQALRLRETILREPLGLTLTEAELVNEPKCFHLGGFDDERLVAVLLLQPLGESVVKMRQVAVSGQIQRMGVGTALIAFAEDFARQHRFTTMIAHARSTALGFYLRLGYSASGEEFIETTIPHRLVTKVL